MTDRKIDPKTLGFDIDGVVADAMRLFIRICREDHGLEIRFEEIFTYTLEECLGIPDEIIQDIIHKIVDGGRNEHLNPLDGAPEVLKRLSGIAAPVRFVTARPEAGSMVIWMADRIGLSEGQAEIVAAGSFSAKAQILHEKRITCFVEDRLETCFDLKSAGIAPILFCQPWNRRPHPFTEVENWRALADLIDW